MRVKICGIKSPEAAKCAVENGADAVGFVFAESKRKISAAAAKEIINTLPENVWKVGVFVNEDLETVEQTAITAGLTHIQLHGEEVPEQFSVMELPIIKSATVTSTEDLERIMSIKADYILLDSPPKNYRGGNGTSFDWELVRDIGKLNKNIILAGGLDPENVHDAIGTIHPFMVDVSSGVETDGEKDFSKIRSFIDRAKRIREEER